MPGKTNPVILEMVIQNAYKVISNDLLINNLVLSGSLELNAFVPGIAEALLDSLELLTNTVYKFNDKCAKYIEIDIDKCTKNLENSHSLITPLISIIGYDKASEIVKKANAYSKTIKQVLVTEKLFTKEEIEKLLDPLNITRPGIVEGGK